MFNPPTALYGAVVSIVAGLALGAIVSSGFYADAAETKPAHCQEQVMALRLGVKCPQGAYLEIQSDGNEGAFVVCHCQAPVILQVPPSQQRLEPFRPPNPEVDSAPKSIEL